MPRKRSAAAESSARSTAPAAPTATDAQGDDELREPASPSLPPRPLLAEPTKRSSLRSLLPGVAPSSRRTLRPNTSPHATHAIFLQLQEYHDRLERACATTFQHALQPPPPRLPRGDGDASPETSEPPPPRRNKPPYARARILESGRDCFRPRRSELAGAPPPSFSTPVGLKDRVLPAAGGTAYVSFHQTTPRTSEFLYGANVDSVRRMRMIDTMAASSSSCSTKPSSSVVAAKDHFALGPGQYDVPPDRPSGAAAKFSPSDRFHENYSTDRPGPGQYLPSETLVTPRATAAVFSQRPRETDLGAVVSPTANVVSSYYYVPESAFRDGSSSDASGRRGHATGWSRTARFASRDGRRARALTTRPPTSATSPATDYIAKNMRDLEAAATAYRQRHGDRRRRQQDAGDSASHAPLPPETLQRRSMLVAAESAAASRQQQTRSSPSCSGGLQRLRSGLSSRDTSELMLQGWTTVACLASVQTKLVRLHAVASALRRVRAAQRARLLSVTFGAWRTLDAARSRQYSRQLILRNVLRFCLWLRIEQKRRHAAMLRRFLGGLTFDVRFALAMKRIKRKIQLLQRWWRHVQLMVRAREEALYHKWVAVETRLRLEYVNQMPHLQRIFQPPAGTVAAATSSHSSTLLAGSGTGGGGGGGSSVGGHGSAHASELQLHKLLSLPDQRRWFTGRFVLSSDGSMRGYALDNNELLVEMRHFRCHYHEVSANGGVDDGGSGSSAQPPQGGDHRASYSTYTNAAWKPFLMLFRQGAFRFVLVTSLSPLPAEILSWRDKLERLMMNPAGTLQPLLNAGSSMSMATPGSSFSTNASSSSFSDLSFFGSVGDLVEVSMQSGILAPASPDHHRGSTSGASASSPTRGRFQSRVRSIRQHTKSGVSVAEGPLSYYVVDLLKDFPKVPTPVVWQTIRDKLREKRKAFRTEIYQYKLEMFHFQQHQEQVQHMHVLEKFRDFFTLDRPRRPHFRSLISTHKMEAVIRSTAEQVKASTPPNPRLLLDSTKL